MKHRTLVLTMAGALGVATVLAAAVPDPTEPGPPTEAEVVSKLSMEVRVLLKDGLCDNIHAAFMVEVERFPKTPAANRGPVEERIEYYRSWLRRKGCG